MTPNVPTSDSGTVIEGMMVAHRWRRKMKMTITTRPMVSSRVNSTSTTESRIDCERSDIRSTWTDCGTEASRRGIIALMLSTTSTVLAPGWRKISSSSPRLPLNQAPVRGDLVASTTVATSCILTGAPLR